MSAKRTVRIDAYPDSAFRYLERDAIVCIDVMTASTMMVTAAAQGRSAFPAADTEEALALAACMTDPLLAVESQGPEHVYFEMKNSPAALAHRHDVQRPLVLVGAAGTQLMINTSGARNVYVACFRNLSVTAEYLGAHHSQVVLLAAGHGSQFRCEDEMAAARIARRLMDLGFECEDNATADLVSRWAEADLALAALGKSVADLRRWGRSEDADFILSHLDDLQTVCRYEEGAVRSVEAFPPRVHAAAGERGQVLPFGVRGRLAAVASPAV